MKRKELTARKLASLVAVGAGALTAGADPAQAGVVVYDPTPDPQVGFAPGAGPFFSYQPGGGPAGLRFTASSTSGFSSSSFYIYRAGVNGLVFRPGFHAAGEQFNPLSAGTNSASVGGLHRYFFYSSYSYGPATSHLHGSGSFSNQYALFRFILSGNTHYGWAEVSFDNPLPGAFGPTLTVHRIAWEDQPDTLLAAGDTVGAPMGVPEPSSIVMTGLGALAMGAAGLRRWRQERGQQARRQQA